MIVTTHAPQRQSQHRSADGHQHVIELIIANAFNRLGRNLSGVGTGHQKPRRRRPHITRLQFVPRQLHAQELVVGQVGIERFDHPVAIVVCPRSKPIELVAATFCKPDDIQPVPRPAFPIMLALQQRVDDLLECLRRFVCDEGCHLFRSRRQSNHIEICPAYQLLFRDWSIRGQPQGIVFGSDKAIDRGQHPRCIFDVRRGCDGQGLKRPELAPFLQVDDSHRLYRNLPHSRINRPHVDPLHEISDDLIRQLTTGGHLDAVISESLNQQAVSRLPLDYGRARIAPVQQAGGKIDVQAAFQLLLLVGLGRMASVTMLSQNGPDLLFEELRALSGCSILRPDDPRQATDNNRQPDPQRQSVNPGNGAMERKP